MASSRSILLIGYGNPGRQDDGLGPRLAQAVEALALPGLKVEADYQLGVEHAPAAAAHEVVIFADAATQGPAPFCLRRISPGTGVRFSTHALEPADVLALSLALFGGAPEAYVLGIRGYVFDGFGERLSDGAQANLAAATAFVARMIRGGTWPADGAEMVGADDGAAVAAGGCRSPKGDGAHASRQTCYPVRG